MPLPIAAGAPTMLIRRASFERVGLSRATLDVMLGLTQDELAVEGELIAVGPIHASDGLERLVTELEARGLEIFDDFFELSGNWPEWVRLFAMGTRDGSGARSSE